jgi:transcriptional regulator GlxA family with amidase domain
MAWLERAVNRAERTASVCTGAFLLGQLGRLDGHRVTTHWLGTEDLRQAYPAAVVEDDRLYIKDRRLWTSAGVLSGVDMMLAMVSEDLDSATALRIARSLVVFLVRDGGQSQFSGPIDLQSKANRSDIVSLVGWLESRLQQHTSVEDMAQQLSTSVRTLHRRCLQALSLTPAQLLSELRLERARNLLHQLNVPLKTIADQCGFANAAAFSKAFSARFSIAPKRYHERFQNHLPVNTAGSSL